MAPAWPLGIGGNQDDPLPAISGIGWAGMETAFPGARRRLLEAVQQVQCSRWVRDYAALVAVEGIVSHGDFTVANLVFQGSRVVGVLDFESSYAPELALYYLMRCVKGFATGEDIPERLLSRGIRAYEVAGGCVSNAQGALLPGLQFVRRIRWAMKMLATGKMTPRVVRAVELACLGQEAISAY